MVFSQDWSGQQVGDYRLLRRLGGGSFGEVYQAEDLRERGLVAVKLIKAPLTEREDLKAFLNEARSIRLRHPHIVSLLDFGLSERDLPYLVMEYVAGGTLRDRYPKGSRVPLDSVINLTTQIASALQYAHDRHLVHRDVKPENMLCRPDDTVLLSDFGIASVAHASSSASAYQDFGGTLPYMAPEQHTGKPRPASDQYALAVVVYEWLAGVRPFQGTIPELVSQHLHAPPPSLVDQIPTLPVQVEQVVFKALSKQPQERFARVEDFAAALQVTSQRRSVPPTLAPTSPAFPTPPQQQPMPDQATAPGQARGGFPPQPPVSSPPPPVRTGADQSVPEEVLSTLPSEAATVAPSGFSKSTTPPSPTPTPRQPQSRKKRSRRVLFTYGLAILVALSGSGLLYFGFLAQRIPKLSPAQIATEVAASHAYTTSTAKQGVMFGFDAAHTNYNPYEQTITPGNVSRLTPLWSFGIGDQIHSAPTVAGGMIYVGAGGSSYNGKLSVFDASCYTNCQPLWSFVTSDQIQSSPAIAGGMVYISSGGMLYAFDASCRQQCQPLWNIAITDQTTLSSPVVAGGMLYIGSGDGRLYAFDATCRQNCHSLWSTALSNQPLSSPTVAGGMVYISSGDGKLYAFDASCYRNCQPLWSFAAEGYTLFKSSPVVAGGVVYVGSDLSQLYAFDASCRKNCQPLWISDVKGIVTFNSSPAVADGMVYLNSENGTLYAFDASCQNCQPVWSFAAGGLLESSPVVAGGVVYMNLLDGKIYAFDASCRQQCQPVWSFDIGNRILSSLVVAGGVVYVSTENGTLYAFGVAS